MNKFGFVGIRQMLKKSKAYSLFLPFIIGIVLGIIAKLIDVPYVTSKFPIFDNIMGRFGIWVWAAAMVSILSKTALFAAVRSFVFFCRNVICLLWLYRAFLKFFSEITDSFVERYCYDYTVMRIYDLADT